MKRWTSAGAVKAISAAAFVGFASQAIAADVDWDRLLNADKDPNNWVMYHGDFTGWHFSGLDQINTGNVDGLKLNTEFRPSRNRNRFGW